MTITKVSDDYIFLKEAAAKLTFVYARSKILHKPDGSFVTGGVVMIYDEGQRNMYVLDQFYKSFKGTVTVFSKFLAGNEVIKTLLMSLDFFQKTIVYPAAIPPAVASKSYSVAQIVSYLNEMLVTDQEAITALVNNRVPCNSAMADHPFVQVIAENGVDKVGLLGILCGMSEALYGYKIYAQFTPGYKKILYFSFSPA